MMLVRNNDVLLIVLAWGGGGVGGGIFSFVVDCRQTGCSSVQMCVVTN